MTAVYLVEPQAEVLSEDHNSIVRWLTGQAGSESAMILNKWDSAGTPTLTLQQINAAGKSLQINDPSGNARFRFGREVAGDDGSAIDVFRIMDGGRMIHATSDGAMHTVNRLMYDHKDALDATVMWQLNYENNSVDATPDVATMGMLGIQRTNDAYFRTLEVDQIAVTGTSTWPKIGIELSVQANHLGNSSDRTVGISVMNFGTGWGLATPQIVDTAYLAVGRQHGFTNYFRALDTDANSGQLLFNVGSTGVVQSRGVEPILDSSFDIGQAAQAWRNLYIDHILVSDLGTVGAPAIGFNADPNTGLMQAAASADTISVVTAGAEQIRVTSAGLLDFRNSQAYAVTASGDVATLAQIANGPAAAGQTHWLQIMIAGTKLVIPAWTSV